MGSQAYGVAGSDSDIDIYAFCMPPAELVFPHLNGEIPGFVKQIQRFEQFQAHGWYDEDGKENDIQVYSIVRYFHLLTENNPNIVDSLYTPDYCVLKQDAIGARVREKRDIFLHKGAYHKFKGYAYSQQSKMRNKNPVGKRAELVAKHSFDIKFGYHLVRLISEIEQILETGTLNLQKNQDQLKSIRHGEWTMEQIEDYFARKEPQLEQMYLASKLPHSPDEPRIKALLLECLETAYGSIDNLLKIDDSIAAEKLRRIRAVLDE
jgi:predicted nucleotidyltransferase